MAERLNGETFKEKAFQPGKLTLIDFYSDSCVPCKRMVPVFAKLEEKYGDQIYIGKSKCSLRAGTCRRIQSYVGADTDFPERRRTDREADRSKESGRSGRNH